MGCCTSKAVRRATEEFDSIDTDRSKSLSADELGQWIGTHAELWAMLAVNLNLEEERCRSIATEVAFQLASEHADGATEARGSDGVKRIMTVTEFVRFRTLVVDDPKGRQNFFHRCVFTAFDSDGNGYLDAAELDRFLETFYKADSIFKGDARLPEKDELRRIVNTKLDTDGDGKLRFEELHGLISGSAEVLSSH